jgi:hypothetical protein
MRDGASLRGAIDGARRHEREHICNSELGEHFNARTYNTDLGSRATPYGIDGVRDAGLIRRWPCSIDV